MTRVLIVQAYSPTLSLGPNLRCGDPRLLVAKEDERLNGRPNFRSAVEPSRMPYLRIGHRFWAYGWLCPQNRSRRSRSGSSGFGDWLSVQRRGLPCNDDGDYSLRPKIFGYLLNDFHVRS